VCALVSILVSRVYVYERIVCVRLWQPIDNIDSRTTCTGHLFICAFMIDGLPAQIIRLFFQSINYSMWDVVFIGQICDFISPVTQYLDRRKTSNTRLFLWSATSSLCMHNMSFALHMQPTSILHKYGMHKTFIKMQFDRFQFNRHNVKR